MPADAARATDRLRSVLLANRSGAPVGVPSVCSAEPFVLRAALEQAIAAGGVALIESTCNQANQEGGYTGLTPADFAAQVRTLAAAAGLPRDRLVIGGDHLGPYPWRDEPADAAMAKARALVRDCVLAGYTKVHLDPSMPLGGDARPLDEATALARTVELCRVAEEAHEQLAAGSPGPVYVVGTEVPRPGGEHAGGQGPAPTRADDVRRFLARAAEAFAAAGLEDAWRRVVAVVAQPGVEFGTWAVHRYDAGRARDLPAALDGTPGLVYEAHSTDYQDDDALHALVRDRFALLKVGPALTFAFREALFALEAVEARLARPDDRPSRLRETLDAAMRADPAHWRDYYRGDEAEVARARLFSLSDRCRYYWPRPEVQGALRRLLRNLAARPVPLARPRAPYPHGCRFARSGHRSR